MKELLKEIAKGMKKKGIVRVYWNYKRETDIYEKCETFYGWERMTSTFEKIEKLPENPEIDMNVQYDDVWEILLK